MFGLNTFKTISVALVVVAAGWAGTAQAATVSASCPDEADWERYFTLSSDDPDVSSISCYGWGEEANDNFDAALNAQLDADGYELVGKVENGASPDSVYDDLISMLGGTGGEFDLTESVEVVLVFKVGGGSACRDDDYEGNACVPVYAAFEVVTTGAALLAWSVDSTGRTNQGLSHVTIYTKPAVIPVPAAGLLLIGALGALGLAKRRRRAA